MHRIKHPLVREIRESLQDILTGVGAAAIFLAIYHDCTGRDVNMGGWRLALLGIVVAFMITSKVFRFYRGTDVPARLVKYIVNSLAVLSAILLVVACGMAYYYGQRPGFQQESGAWVGLAIMIIFGWSIAGAVYRIVSAPSSRH